MSTSDTPTSPPAGAAGSPAPQAPRKKQSWAARLYLGEAGINIDAWRRKLFIIAAAIVLISFASIAVRGFHFGIEFVGGNAFTLPASVGSLTEVEDAVEDAGATVVSSQEIGGQSPQYTIRTLELSSQETESISAELADQFGIDRGEISDDRVSGAWGGQITRQALIALAVFIGLLIVYLIIRFEARAAVAAVSSLVLSLITTAGVYSVVGFEVSPATVIGFLTIMGFDLYDTVVTFDKVEENTKGITGSVNRTYGEAANLAVNQVVIRSINTSVVALLPVGALLFIGAGLLGAGTLKDLGLVLFVGMSVGFYTSLFFAAPMLVELKTRQPRYQAHTARVLAKRAALANREAQKRTKQSAGPADDVPAQPQPVTLDPELIDLAAAAPKVGVRPAQSKRSGRRRPSGGKPSGTKPTGAKQQRR